MKRGDKYAERGELILVVGYISVDGEMLGFGEGGINR